MINKGIDPTTGELTHSEDLFFDEKTEKRIQQHFSDINDVISEQDILNVKTNVDEETTVSEINHKQAVLNQEDDDVNKEPAHTVKDKEPEPIVSSWNVLS